MEHHFNIHFAEKFGIVEAILINNFTFWLSKNKANNKHFHDGRYWTFNSKQAIQEQFPYLSYDKVKRALDNLREKGVLVTGNYNTEHFDKTLWYSFSDGFLEYAQSLGEDCLMRCANSTNREGKNAQPIPYNVDTDSETTDIRSSLNNKNIIYSTTNKKVKKELDLSFVSIHFEDVFNRWLNFHKEIKKPYTQSGAEACYQKLLELSGNDPSTADKIVSQSMANGWQGLFQLKQDGNTKRATMSAGQMLSCYLDSVGFKAV